MKVCGIALGERFGTHFILRAAENETFATRTWWLAAERQRCPGQIATGASLRLCLTR